MTVAAQAGNVDKRASVLPLAGLLVFGGRLGDLIGLRRVFLIGAALFTSASAVGGLAPDLPLLWAMRVLQGVGGALMLPTTVAIVSATFPAEQRGRALGTMGGAAAVFAALGPTIGGSLTSVFSWRAVLLLAGLVFGLSQSQPWGWDSPGVILSLLAAVLAIAAFVVHERRTPAPLMDFALLRERNYLGASISQMLAGMAEIGLGVIFPLLLILNLEMDPGLAGLALIPTTLPMILIAPLAGRWYDSAGGRPPLVVGFLLLAVSGVLLAIGVESERHLSDTSYATILPGLILYGIGLSLVLTVNDPVSLDTIAERDQGQASGVSATAVHPSAFDPELLRYVEYAGEAATRGYSVTFLAVAVLALLGAAATGWLVRKPPALRPRRDRR